MIKRKIKPLIKILIERDLPNRDSLTHGLISMDTEFLGLKFLRDRLCLIQIFDHKRNLAYIIQLPKKVNPHDYPNLIDLLVSRKFTKIFHYAIADLIQLNKTFKIETRNVLCTRTLSKITRTSGGSHGLAALTKEYLQISLNKSLTQSYWGSKNLKMEQLLYALDDVLYLHFLLVPMFRIAIREDRLNVFKRMNKVIALSAQNFIEGFPTEELLEH